MSASRSRSPRRTPLDETALQSLISKKLVQWLTPNSEEISLLAQFCATICHADNWKQEIQEEIRPFLHDDTDEFLSWLTKSRWKDAADTKFGKAALKLRERALQEATGTLPPPPEFKVKPVKERNIEFGKAPYRVDDVDMQGYMDTPTGYSACSFDISSYAMPVNPIRRAPVNENTPIIPAGMSSEYPMQDDEAEFMVAQQNASMERTAYSMRIPERSKHYADQHNHNEVDMSTGYEKVASAPWDNSKGEYENLTLGGEPAKEKSVDRRLIHNKRRNMLEHQTRILKNLLTRLTDPKCDEKQKEKLIGLVSKVKEQMDMIKKTEIVEAA